MFRSRGSPQQKDGNLNVCALTLITTHGGSTRCRQTTESTQRTSPSTPTTARATGLETGQSQMRNSATVDCLANFMNSPSQRAQEANHRPCARPGMWESRSASLMFCCCGHSRIRCVPAVHDWSRSDPLRWAAGGARGKEGRGRAVSSPPPARHERPVDSFHGCTRRDTFASRTCDWMLLLKVIIIMQSRASRTHSQRPERTLSVNFLWGCIAR